MECKRGNGTFQWNAGGWFGSQIGSTCWMLGSGLLYLKESPLLGVLLLICFLVANLVGTAIWSKRDKVDPYMAMQILFVVVFVTTTAALISADYLGLLGKLDPRIENPNFIYLLLLLFPALMVVFHRRNNSKPTEARRHERDETPEVS